MIASKQARPGEGDVTAERKEELNPLICHPECSFSGFQVVCVSVSLNRKKSWGPVS